MAELCPSTVVLSIAVIDVLAVMNAKKNVRLKYDLGLRLFGFELLLVCFFLKEKCLQQTEFFSLGASDTGMLVLATWFHSCFL